MNDYEDYHCPTRHDCNLIDFRIDNDIQRTTSMIPVEWRGFNDDADDVGFEYRLQYRHDRDGQVEDEWSSARLIDEDLNRDDWYHYQQNNLNPARVYNFKV